MNRRELILAAVGTAVAGLTPALTLPQSQEPSPFTTIDFGILKVYVGPNEPVQTWFCFWNETDQCWWVRRIIGGALSTFPEPPRKLTYAVGKWDAEANCWVHEERIVGRQQLLDQIAKYGEHGVPCLL